MKRQETLKAMREIVRDLGETITWEDNGVKQTFSELMLLNILLRENDVYTSVFIDHYGQLCLSGYDGVSKGWANLADHFGKETIYRVYAAMLDWQDMIQS